MCKYNQVQSVQSIFKYYIHLIFPYFYEDPIELFSLFGDIFIEFLASGNPLVYHRPCIITLIIVIIVMLFIKNNKDDSLVRLPHNDVIH